MKANLEVLTSAFGEMLNEFGGLRLTRLTAAVAPGASSLVVEHSATFPATGSVSIDGITYAYATNANNTLGNIAIDIGNAVVPGAQMLHRESAAVIDTSQTASALDWLRRGLFVNTAIGDDLNIIGRNLGVNRFPDIQDDETFRAIVKALAYNPQGTIYGLSLAMDAIAGVGNYLITEDLINKPCHVSITVPGALFLSQTLQGNTFLQAPVTQPASNGAMSYVYTGGATTPYLRATELTLHDENFWTDCRTALPTAAMQSQFPNDASPVWTFEPADSGNTESNCTTVVTTYGGSCQFVANVGYYTRAIQASSASEVRVRALMMLPAGGLLSGANNASQFGGSILVPIDDGAGSYVVSYGCYDLGSGRYAMLLSNSPNLIILRYGIFYDVELRRRAQNVAVELCIDGKTVERQPLSIFPASDSDNSVSWGNLQPSGSSHALKAVFRYLGVYCHTATDYWCARGQSASVAASAPNTITLPSNIFVSGDVGKQLRVMGSSVGNIAPGQVTELLYSAGPSLTGTNNCSMVIQSVINGTQATIATPPMAGAQVTTSDRIILPSNVLTFPDDIGKQITLAGSASSNNGTYTIARLLEPHALVDFAERTTVITASTSICEVTDATLSPVESNLTFSIEPSFVNESNLTWELSDASTLGPLHTETVLGNMLPANVASCGDEDGALNTFVPSNSDTPFAVNATSGGSYALSGAEAWQGVASVRVFPGGTDYFGLSSSAIPCLPNTAYTYSVYVRTVDMPFTIVARLIDNSSADGGFHHADYSENIDNTAWVRLSATLTTGADATAIQGRVYSAVQADYQYYTDGWQLETGSAASAWALPPPTAPINPPTQRVFSFRAPLPYPNGVYDIGLNQYLSAQVFNMPGIFNDPDSSGNFNYWPFYVNDPLSAVENYITLITAAGVTVDFTFI